MGISIVNTLTPSPKILALGVQNTDYAVDFNRGLLITVTTGSGPATITIPNYANSALAVKGWLLISQGSTARTQTLGATGETNNNIKSSGGLMSAGKSLPNSGVNAVDAFEFTWSGNYWYVSNVLYDIKA